MPRLCILDHGFPREVAVGTEAIYAYLNAKEAVVRGAVQKDDKTAKQYIKAASSGLEEVQQSDAQSDIVCQLM